MTDRLPPREQHTTEHTDPIEALDRRTDRRLLPPLWLGGSVACLTALGLGIGTLSGSEPAPSAVAAVPRSTSDTPVATSTATAAQAIADPSIPSPPSTVPAAPVLTIGASIPPLADLISAIGGSRVDVVSVVPQGVDGHTYEPTPSDVADITRADVTFVASIDLNPAVTRTIEANMPSESSLVDLLAATMSDDQLIVDQVHSHGNGNEHGHANVHVWTDPTIALRWVGEIERQLAGHDPGGASTYAANAADLGARISVLHEATITATATVPAEFRTLVVYHDSWSYFGRTYGYEVLGALQAADFAEPSAAEVARMVEDVRESGAPAFFGAAVFPTEVLERVSEEAGVPYVPDLADDELPGRPGDAEHGYIGMMTENVRHIVTSLGGDASALDRVAP